MLHSYLQGTLVHASTGKVIIIDSLSIIRCGKRKLKDLEFKGRT